MPTIGSIAGSVGKLTSAARSKIPSSKFGLPGSRKYPMPDKSHAANAKARATQQVKKGNLSSSAKQQIDAKANRILGKAKPTQAKMQPGSRASQSAYRKEKARVTSGY